MFKSKEAKKAYESAYYKANKKTIDARVLAWHQANPEKNSAHTAKWRKEKPHKHNTIQAKYRASKLNATPKWLTQDQLKEIEWYYETAQELQWLSEEPLHVDHIVPLQGENVSGLHAPWNLQILPRSLNCSKSNKKAG